MSISPINVNNPAINSTQFLGISSTNSGAQDSDRNNQGSRLSGASGVHGKFALVVSQALSHLGISFGASSSTSDTSSTTSTQDPQQALDSFMHNLFAALHGNGTAQSTISSTNQAAGGSDSGGDNDGGGTSAVSGTSGNGHQQHYGGWVSNLESNLQNLIQRLSSSSSQGASDSSTAGSSSSNSALDALQQSFNGLLSANGVSGGNASLSSFLQSLSQDLQGAPATGNVVTAKV
jgi:hypothetical protein